MRKAPALKSYYRWAPSSVLSMSCPSSNGPCDRCSLAALVWRNKGRDVDHGVCTELKMETGFKTGIIPAGQGTSDRYWRRKDQSRRHKWVREWPFWRLLRVSCQQEESTPHRGSTSTKLSVVVMALVLIETLSGKFPDDPTTMYVVWWIWRIADNNVITYKVPQSNSEFR